MSALEKTLETWGLDRLREVGASPIKIGFDGLPDRLVLWGRGAHFWIEFKKDKKAKVRPMQKVWKKYLTRIGDQDYFITSRDQLEDIIAIWRDLYGPANANWVVQGRQS